MGFQGSLGVDGPWYTVACLAGAAEATLMPNLPAVRFENLRLALGSELGVKMPPFISFRGGGQLSYSTDRWIRHCKRVA